MAWHAKEIGAYAIGTNEGDDNAKMIVDILSARGWSFNAICGILGNIQNEGGMNPWRWQSDIVRSTAGNPWDHIGYGLVQYTPAGKYINTAQDYTGYGPNFSDRTGDPNDGTAQMIYLDEQEGYYPTSAYPMTLAEYKASNDNPGTLAEVWLYNYERPTAEEAEKSKPDRVRDANSWYEELTGYTPGPTPGPTPSTSRSHMPVWMMLLGR